MNSKKWLSVFAVVSLLLIGAAGYFCFHFASLYNQSKSGWNSRATQIEGFKKNTLYPNPQNVEKLKTIRDNYKASVDKLFVGLNEFQRPLQTDLVDSKFSIEMTQQASEFRDYCAVKGFEIQDVENFGLGFETYSSTTPAKDIVAELEYSLNATKHLLQILVESGANDLEYLARDLIAGEAGGPKVDPSNTVAKYPIRLAFNTKHQAFQTFVNSLPNDEKYFYVVRILQVNNTSAEGPIKGAFESSQELVFESEATGESSTPEQVLDWGLGTLSPAEITSNAKRDGYLARGQDARELLGNELINVFMVVDIVRFVDPTTVKVAENNKSSKKKAKR